MKKTILITGSTDGIGKLTALNLAKQGHKIYIHGRNFDKVAKTIEELKFESKNLDIKGFLSDFSDLHSVNEMIGEIKEDLESIDILINNAGVFKTDIADNKDGLDLRIVVNYLSAYFLTNQLLPLLKKSENPRVISLSSAAQAPIEESVITGEKKADLNNTYAQSKLAIAFMSEYFSKKYKDINFISVNPGSLLATKMAKQAYGTFWSNADKGSDILTDLAISDTYENDSGKYFDNDNGAFGVLYGEDYNQEKVEKWIKISDELIDKYK